MTARRFLRFKYCFVLLVFLSGIAVHSASAQSPAGYTVSKEPMGKLAAWVDLNYVKYSQDGKHIAHLVALANEQGSEYFWVVDGKEHKRYKGMLESAGWSPDGKTFIYGAQDARNKGYAVVNGNELPLKVRGIGPPAFSPDSKRYLFEATFSSGNGGWYHDLVVDGKPLGKRTIGMKHGVFSPDSKQFAYVEITGRGQRVVVNDTHYHLSRGVIDVPLTFTPDSTGIAYQAEFGGKVGLFLNDVQRAAYEGTHLPVVVSPDSKRLAVLCRVGRHTTWMVDGQFGGELYGGTHDLVFSPDSKHFIFYARPIGEDPSYAIMDGKRLKHAYQDYGGIPERMVFSKGCERWAIIGKIAGDNKNWYVVINDEKGAPQSKIALGSFQFSPDGKHYIYRAKFKKKWQLMKDHEQVHSPTSVLLATYSPGGRLVTISETAQGDGSEIMVDGQLIAQVLPLFKKSEITFSDDKTFHIWTYKDEKLTRVDVSMP